jgi:carbonic anhydrase
MKNVVRIGWTESNSEKTTQTWTTTANNKEQRAKQNKSLLFNTCIDDRLLATAD